MAFLAHPWSRTWLLVLTWTLACSRTLPRTRLHYSLYFVLISWCPHCSFVCVWFPRLALISCRPSHLYPLCETNASGWHLYSDHYSFDIRLDHSHLLSRLAPMRPLQFGFATSDLKNLVVVGSGLTWCCRHTLFYNSHASSWASYH